MPRKNLIQRWFYNPYRMTLCALFLLIVSVVIVYPVAASLELALVLAAGLVVVCRWRGVPLAGPMIGYEMKRLAQ